MPDRLIENPRDTRAGEAPCRRTWVRKATRARNDEYSQVEEKGQAQSERLERPNAEHDKGSIDNLPATIDVDNAKLPASYERAKQALVECESIDECKAWADKAAALAAYGRMQEDTELEKHALRIRAHAARRAGELLHEIRGETGGRPSRTKNSGAHSPEFSDASLEPADKRMSARATAARAAGMSQHQVKEAMRVATVPKDAFDRQVNSSKPPSVATLAKQGTHKRSQPTASAGDAPQTAAVDHKNSIGAESVARALVKWRADISPAQQNEIKVNTRERRAFVGAIERLPRSDAEWARKFAFFVEQEAREKPQ
jgi:hypothetical protein